MPRFIPKYAPERVPVYGPDIDADRPRLAVARLANAQRDGGRRCHYRRCGWIVLRALLTPTLAYRPAVLFGLTLVFGWRRFVWSQLLFFTLFGALLDALPRHAASHLGAGRQRNDRDRSVAPIALGTSFFGRRSSAAHRHLLPDNSRVGDGGR